MWLILLILIVTLRNVFIGKQKSSGWGRNSKVLNKINLNLTKSNIIYVFQLIKEIILKLGKVTKSYLGGLLRKVSNLIPFWQVI